ncbi:hypothetical protein ACFZDK_41130 [Streptomyces sp. NPDC007901]|uniref:hypothetical protein n=1 Tax=Streptomyces sp. NPDC007901 TaxID=3364785 RepID=UPI0036E42EB2
MVEAQAKSSDWRISVAVAAVPALASILAAVVAALSARKAKKSEIDAQRLRDLEARISEKKYEVYKPMINLFRDILDQRSMPEEDLRSRISEFSAWVSIFGSDEAVRAFHNFMQAAYTGNPPAVVLMKLYSDFVLSARRDMGYPDTAVDARCLLGMRISDLYTSGQMVDVNASLAELCRATGWTPPWEPVPAT